VEDFGSLLGFLGAYPFDKPSTFNSTITKPITTSQSLDGIRSLQKLVQAVALRRTKSLVYDDLGLPKLHVRFHDVHLSEEERKNYNILKNSYKAIFNQHWLDGKHGSTSHIFQTILQLRQFCNHGLDLLPQNVLEIFQASSGRDNSLANILSTPEACVSCGQRIDQGESDAVESKASDCDSLFCRKCRGRVEGEDHCGGEFGEFGDEAVVSRTLGFSPGDSDTYHYTPSSKVISLLENLRTEREGTALSPVKRYFMSPPLRT